MADLVSETLSDKLIKAQKSAKIRRYDEVLNTLYSSIKSNPFTREVSISVESKEEANYIEKKLKEDGLSPRINSHFEISRKINCIDVIIPLPIPKEKELKENNE